MITFFEVRVRDECPYQTVRVAGRPFARGAVTLVRSDQMNDEIRDSEFLHVTPPAAPEPAGDPEPVLPPSPPAAEEPAGDPEPDLSADNVPTAEEPAGDPEPEEETPAEDVPVKRGKKKGGA